MKSITLVNGKSVLEVDSTRLSPITSVNIIDADRIGFFSQHRMREVRFSELEDVYGTTDAYTLHTYLIENDFFKVGGGESSITLPIAISDVTGLDDRFLDLENKVIKAIWYETFILNTDPNGQTFTITPPTGATIIENGWDSNTTALVKEVRDSVPTDSDIPDNDSTTPEIVVSATLDTLGNGVIVGNCNIVKYPIVAIVYYYSVAWKDYNPLSDINDLIIVDEGISQYTGHEQYTDSQYIEASPFVISNGTRTAIPNNGTGDLLDSMPSDYKKLWDAILQKVIAQYTKDEIDLRITFKAKSSLNNGRFDWGIDIGNGSIIEIVGGTENFSKSANTEQSFQIVTPLYSRGTFVTNGAKIYITPNNNMSIYNIVFVIYRRSKNL